MKKFFYSKTPKKNKKNQIKNIVKKNLLMQETFSNSNLEKNKSLIKKIKQKKNKKRAKLMLIIKIIIILLLLFMGFKIFSIVGKFNKKLNLNNIGLSESDEAAERQISNITNVVLLGIDDNNVSDAILIASLDKTNKNLKLISVARDSLVPIENPKTKKIYYSKINEAYSHGGEATILRTLNKNFNIRLMEYITINFEGLVDVIDKLGGVEIEISQKESRDIDGIINSTKSLKQKHNSMLKGQYGTVHLNGSQAVAYVRIRKTETLNGLNDDFGRTYRQRAMINLVFKKMMNLPKSKSLMLIKTLLNHMKTSLDLKTIFNIYSCVKGKGFEVKPTQIPLPSYTVDPNYIYNNKSTVFYDLDYASNIINNLIYNNIDQEQYIQENPPKIKQLQNNRTAKQIKHNYELSGIQTDSPNQFSKNKKTKTNSSKKLKNSKKTHQINRNISKKIANFKKRTDYEN